MAPWWSWSSAEGRCREDGSGEEGSGVDFEGENGSPSSQASISGLENQGRLMAKE